MYKESTEHLWEGSARLYGTSITYRLERIEGESILRYGNDRQNSIELIFVNASGCPVWYPNGDRNSLTYIAITDEKLIWYQFDPEQGDVQRGAIRLMASSGGAYKCTFALGDGNKFTVECTSLFHELSRGTLTLKDCTKDSCENMEYDYSKR